MKALTRPKIPKAIARECRTSISNVSITLAELKSRNLIRCKTPDAHSFKFYEITKKGKEAIREIEGFMETEEQDSSNH